MRKSAFCFTRKCEYIITMIEVATKTHKDDLVGAAKPNRDKRRG